MSAYSTKIVIVVAMLLLIGYDVYLAFDKKRGNTYSEVLRGWFKSMTWLPVLVSFALGVLMAHWGLK